MQDVDLRSFFLLALPAMGSALLNNAYRIIDQYMVQWLGPEVQAAIGSSTFVLIAAYACFQIIAGGATPLFSQAIGAKRVKESSTIAFDALIGATIIGLFFTLCFGLFSLEIALATGLRGETALLMSSYLSFLAPFGILFALSPTIEALFIASGNTVYPLKLELWSMLLNALLNWIFIYELNMGIQGAAMASGISRLVIVLGLFRLWNQFELRWALPQKIVQMTKLGIPIMLGTMSFALVYFGILRWVISPLGAQANAALGIGFSAIEGMSWPIYSGMMVALSSLIGRQIGAGRIDLCKKTIQIAFPAAFSIGLMLGGTMFCGAELICTQFTTDPTTLALTIAYCQIIGLSQCFVAIEALCEGYFIGSGATTTLFLTSTPINILRIPVGWYCAYQLGWGAQGVWWAITATTITKTALRSFMVLRIQNKLSAQRQKELSAAHDASSI